MQGPAQGLGGLGWGHSSPLAPQRAPWSVPEAVFSFVKWGPMADFLCA